jgi:hypothetical protein
VPCKSGARRLVRIIEVVNVQRIQYEPERSFYAWVERPCDTTLEQVQALRQPGGR